MVVGRKGSGAKVVETREVGQGWWSKGGGARVEERVGFMERSVLVVYFEISATSNCDFTVAMFSCVGPLPDVWSAR